MSKGSSEGPAGFCDAAGRVDALGTPAEAGETGRATSVPEVEGGRGPTGAAADPVDGTMGGACSLVVVAGGLGGGSALSAAGLSVFATTAARPIAAALLAPLPAVTSGRFRAEYSANPRTAVHAFPSQPTARASGERDGGAVFRSRSVGRRFGKWEARGGRPRRRGACAGLEDGGAIRPAERSEGGPGDRERRLPRERLRRQRPLRRRGRERNARAAGRIDARR